ncbi:MAG: NAD(P)-dependent oxidoreductase, partial [Rubrivivax sp.]|nr:NAD(P)-dependent oxidoreductase [Rubrivivax sp.]
MRIIVTGGSGFLGRALVHELMRRRVDTVAVVRHHFDVNLPQIVISDYILTPPGDVLVHLAETRDISAAEAQGEAHIAQTTKTLQQLLCKGFKRIVYASSAVVYGDNVSIPHRPAESPVLSDTYVRVKVACE